MDTYRLGLDQLPQGGVVAALGTFDGVHLGHQAVLHETVSEANRRGMVSAAVTFSGHPAGVLRPESTPKLLTSLTDRLTLMADLGVERAYLIDFTEQEALRSAQEFVNEVLLSQAGVRVLVAGDDLHFAHRREGTLSFLRDHQNEFDLSVVVVKAVNEIGVEVESVSSAAIRRSLRGGDVSHAADLLGRLYRLSGLVVKGDQRGRTIGFPTANIPMDEERAWPTDGVYAGWCTLPDDERYPCAINIGRRPTFYQHASQSLLEAHLIDFQGDLYGQECRVDFVKFLRGERRFEGVDELVAQLEIDVAAARQVLDR